MRVVGRTAWMAALCLPLAGAFDLWSGWHADRMASGSEGWEMAFYFSPLAFRVMDGILLLACVLGIGGMVLGPRWYHRVVAVTAAVVGGGLFTQLPWQ